MLDWHWLLFIFGAALVIRVFDWRWLLVFFAAALAFGYFSGELAWQIWGPQ